VICESLKVFSQRALRTQRYSGGRGRIFIQKYFSNKLNLEDEMRNLCELCDLSERKKRDKRVVNDL